MRAKPCLPVVVTLPVILRGKHCLMLPPNCRPQQDDAQATLSDDSLLTSTEVLDLARDHNIELSLSLKSGLRATHYLYSEPDGQYFHKDIDGVIREIYPEDFLDTYPDSLGKIWRIDQKVN